MGYVLMQYFYVHIPTLHRNLRWKNVKVPWNSIVSRNSLKILQTSSTWEEH